MHHSQLFPATESPWQTHAKKDPVLRPQSSVSSSATVSPVKIEWS